MRNNLTQTEMRTQEVPSVHWSQARVDGLRRLARELVSGAVAGRSVGTYRAAVPAPYAFSDGFEPLLAADAGGLLHLLLPVESVRTVREDHESIGVILSARELVAENSKRLAYADLECRSAALSDTYLLLADEVLASLSGEGRTRADVVAREALSRWRELLTKADGERLSITELAGLFGELTFIEQGENPAALLAVWAGPDRKRHDFSDGGGAAEIKTTLSSDSERIVLHGISQLEPPPDGQLFLVRYRLERSPGGEGVPSLIEQICARGVSPLAIFSKLLRAGYLPEESTFYSSVRFVVRKRQVWRVDRGFPRLAPASFAGGSVPPGIQILQYELDLSMAKNWECEYEELRGALGGA